MQTNLKRETKMANIEMNEYEAVTDRDTDQHVYLNAVTDRDTHQHVYLNVGDCGSSANAAAVNRNNTASARISWKKICLLLLGGILLCIAISTVTGVVVYHVVLGSGPSTSPGEATTPRINITDAINTRLKTVVQEMMEETLTAVVQASVEETLNKSVLSQYHNLRKLLDAVNSSHSRELDSIKNKIDYSERAIAFSVHSPTGSLVNLSPIFTHILVNTGSYNQTTGLFTCPKAGIYTFSVTLYPGNINTSNIYCYYQVNGDNTILVQSYHDAHDTSSGTMVVPLDVGDVVGLLCSGWDGLDSHGYGTSFSGVFITPN